MEKEMAEIEKLEEQLGDDPANILFSEENEEIISYRQKVLQDEKNKDDFLFSLAGNKGETIESLSRMTLSDIMSFAERLSNGRH